MVPVRMSRFLVLFAIMLTMAIAAHGTDANTVAVRQQQFKQLLADEWNYEMRESPESATQIGDYRYNDRWSDISLAHVQQQEKDVQAWLARFEAVDTAGFSEQEKLSETMMVRSLKENIEDFNFKNYEMPVDQINGLQLQPAQLTAIFPFDSTKQYEDYIARLHRLPAYIDQMIEVMRQGEKDKLMPPRYLLEKTVGQCKSIAEPVGDANVFGQPATHFPDSVSAADPGQDQMTAP